MFKGRLKQFKNWLKHRIVWLLVFVTVANLFNALLLPKKARAVNTDRPASDGTYTQWTPSLLGSHYVEVNDSLDTTYVRTTTALNQDSYGLTSGQLPSGSNVTQIKVWARASREHATKTASFTIFYRKDAADTFGSSQAMNNGYTDHSETWSGLSWTDTDINNLEIGIRLDALQAGAKPSVSEMWIEVTYYAISSLTTDKGSYPTLGETITANSTVKNGSSAIISGSTADYVIFIDTGTPDNQPTAGETYMYTTGTTCDTSGQYGTDGPGYTRRWSVPNVAVDDTQSDINWTCVNSNFPDNTTYTLWMKWYNGATTYDTAYVTFTSIPTLGEIGFLAFVAGAVFFAVKAGFIKINNNNGQANFLDSQLQKRGAKRRGEPLPNQNSNSSNSQVSFLDFQLQNRGMKKRGETAPSQNSNSSNQNQGSVIVTAPLGRIRDPKRLVDAITRSKNSKEQSNEQRP